MSDPPRGKDLSRLVAMTGARLKEGDDDIPAIAREKILATRDFDVRLRDYLELKREKWREIRSGASMNDYNGTRRDLLKSVGNVKDPRVVRFLGELLSDTEWTQDPAELARIKADWAPTRPNASLAAEQLRNLVEGFPSNRAFGIKMEKDIIPWVTWYEEVKAGKRSFSFVGQDTVYRFNRDGSWVVSAAGESVPGGELVEKAPEGPRRNLKSRRTPEHVEPPGRVVWPWVAGAVLAALFIWRWMNRRGGEGW